MTRELITDSRERNYRDREAAEYVDERLGAPRLVGGQTEHLVWSLKGKIREGFPTL